MDGLRITDGWGHTVPVFISSTSIDNGSRDSDGTRGGLEDTVNVVVKVKAGLLEVDGGVTLDGSMTGSKGSDTSKGVGEGSAGDDGGFVTEGEQVIASTGLGHGEVEGDGVVTGDDKRRSLANNQVVREDITLEGIFGTEFADNVGVVSKAITVDSDGFETFKGAPARVGSGGVGDPVPSTSTGFVEGAILRVVELGVGISVRIEEDVDGTRLTEATRGDEAVNVKVVEAGIDVDGDRVLEVLRLVVLVHVKQVRGNRVVQSTKETDSQFSTPHGHRRADGSTIGSRGEPIIEVVEEDSNLNLAVVVRERNVECSRNTDISPGITTVVRSGVVISDGAVGDSVEDEITGFFEERTTSAGRRNKSARRVFVVNTAAIRRRDSQKGDLEGVIRGVTELSKDTRLAVGIIIVDVGGFGTI